MFLLDCDVNMTWWLHFNETPHCSSLKATRKIYNDQSDQIVLLHFFLLILDHTVVFVLFVQPVTELLPPIFCTNFLPTHSVFPASP